MMNQALQIFNLLVIVRIVRFLNNMYLSSDTFFRYFISWCFFLMKKSLCHQIVFQPEFFPLFAWVYDTICYGLQHICLYFFSCDDLLIFFFIFFSIFFLYSCDNVFLHSSVKQLTQFSLFSIMRQFTLSWPCVCSCFLVEPCNTLFLLIPQPVQYTALFLGFGVSLVMSPIVFAQLMAT